MKLRLSMAVSFLQRCAPSTCALALGLASVVAYADEPSVEVEVAPVGQTVDVTPAASIERMRADLMYLASDELEGRDSGSPGIRLAAEFIVARHNELGLDTQVFGESPFQEFTIAGTDEATDPANRLEFSGEATFAGQLGKGFTAFSLGNNAAFEGPAVFAGYGITAPELDYDDYADIDVKDKVVIVLRREPQLLMEDSKFNGTENTQHAYFKSKIINARQHGAAAMILVNDFGTAESDLGDLLMPASMPGKVGSIGQVPMMQATREFIAPTIESGSGKSLDELEKAIDMTGMPASHELAGVHVTGETRVTRERKDVRNVLAVMPGKGKLAEEYLIVGAHYDHVGRGLSGSLANGSMAIHNGADDNGSGTVTILEVARRLSQETHGDRRTIVFMSFTAEEKGLLGSQHYVANPRWPLSKTVAMVNLDMVGRLTNNALELYGTGTAAEFPAMIDRINSEAGFDLVIHPEGSGPSDHASFYQAGLPVFHFFTGLHSQYHRPSDDVELINFEGMERIATMVTDVVREIATKPEPPHVTRAVVKRRAILGVQIDTSVEGSVGVSSLTTDGPAETAGVQVGDVIVSIDGKAIESFDALREILAAQEPGDEIKVKLQRGEETIEVQLTLGGA